jgi:hypothetical protein
MGQAESKLVFKQGIFRLQESKAIPADDPYWTGVNDPPGSPYHTLIAVQFWELPESTEDVFNLFSGNDIRRTIDLSLSNLETLILAITSRLFALRSHPSFPHPEKAPEKDLLNCIRILTRILPFIYEADDLEAWEEKFFWSGRRTKIRNEPGPTEVLYDGAEPDRNMEGEQEKFVDARPLGEELLDALLDLLFLAGFTLPASGQSREKVTYEIWTSGVGRNSPVASNGRLESNRTEILRLLITLSSRSMYIPPNVLAVKGVRATTYIATCPDKQTVLSTLCSLLNTTLKYSPATWKIPYDYMVVGDPRHVYIAACLHSLLILLLYPIPEQGGGPPSKNNFRHFLGRLHREQDFQLLADGMARTLQQPVSITSRLGTRRRERGRGG